MKIFIEKKSFKKINIIKSINDFDLLYPLFFFFKDKLTSCTLAACLW
uniref:Uncharacterized protein n=1 Tax=Rhizophora mucronata TaxID=61149 RepID=A0A2P2NRM5_RHIMU